MARFHLHVRDRLGFAQDEEGQELASLEDAERAAMQGARSMLGEEVRSGALDLRGSIEVTDGEGRLLRTIRYADIVTVTRPDAGG